MDECCCFCFHHIGQKLTICHGRVECSAAVQRNYESCPEQVTQEALDDDSESNLRLLLEGQLLQFAVPCCSIEAGRFVHGGANRIHLGGTDLGRTVCWLVRRSSS
jgi:hypothetical protein